MCKTSPVAPSALLIAFIIAEQALRRKPSGRVRAAFRIPSPRRPTMLPKNPRPLLLLAAATCAASSAACIVHTSGHNWPHEGRPPAARPAVIADDPDEPCTPPPDGALVLQEGHRARVTQVAYSPDGSAVASGAEDGSVKIWDAATGALRATLCGVKDEIRYLSFSEDGRSLAASGVFTQVWDMATGARRAQLAGPGHFLNDFAWNRDGRTITSYRVDTGLELWDAETGARRAMLDPKLNTTFAFASSPRADIVAGAGGEVLRLWSTQTGKLLGEIKGPSDFVMSVSFSPDGDRLAAAGKDRRVRVLDIAQRKELFSLDDGDTIWEVAWSPSGALIASLHADHKVTLWDPRTQKPARRLDTGPAAYIAWNPQGTELAVSAAEQPVVQIWDAVTGKMRVAGSADKALPRYAWSPDGKTIAIPDDRGVGIWDAHIGQPRIRLGAPPIIDASADLGVRVTLSPGGSRVLVANREDVQWIPVGEGAQAGAGAQACLEWPIGVVLVSADDTTLVIAESGNVSIVDLRTGKPRASFPWERQRYGTGTERLQAREISLRPDGRSLALAKDGGNIELRDTETGALLATWQAHPLISSVAFSPDGATLLSKSNLGRIRLWDAASHAPLRELPSNDAYLLTMSGDGRTIAWSEFRPNGRGGLDFGAQPWDMKTNTILRWLPLVSGDGIVLSPDGRQLLSYDNDGVQAPALWDTEKATRQAELFGASYALGSAVFRADGAALATAAVNTVDLWDTRTFARLARIDTTSSVRSSLAFTKDGGTLIIGGPVLRLYRIADHATLAVHARPGTRSLEQRTALLVLGPGGVFDADEALLDSLRVRRGPILGKDPLVGARDAPMRRHPGLLRDFLAGRPVDASATMAQDN